MQKSQLQMAVQRQAKKFPNTNSSSNRSECESIIAPRDARFSGALLFSAGWRYSPLRQNDNSSIRPGGKQSPC